MDIGKKVDEILEKKPDFTGQINVEIHIKEGKIVDVYINSRSKVTK